MSPSDYTNDSHTISFLAFEIDRPQRNMSNDTGRPPPLPPRTSTSLGVLNAAARPPPPPLPPRQISQATTAVDGEVVVSGAETKATPMALDTPVVAVVPDEPAVVDVPGETKSVISLEPLDPSTATSTTATKPTTTSSSASKSLPKSDSVPRKDEAGKNWFSPQTWINAVAGIGKEETEDVKLLREQVEQEEIKRYMNNFTKVSSRMGRWTWCLLGAFSHHVLRRLFTQLVSLDHLARYAARRLSPPKPDFEEEETHIDALTHSPDPLGVRKEETYIHPAPRDSWGFERGGEEGC